MKKVIAVLLSLILVSNFVLIYFAAENIKLMKELLSKDFSSGVAVQQEQPQPDAPKIEQTGERIEIIRVVEDKYLSAPNDWIFNFNIKNTTDVPLYLLNLTLFDNGTDEMVFDAQNRPELMEMIMGPDYATRALQPDEVLFWNDAHPGENLTSRS